MGGHGKPARLACRFYTMWIKPIPDKMAELATTLDVPMVPIDPAVETLVLLTRCGAVKVLLAGVTVQDAPVGARGRRHWFR